MRSILPGITADLRMPYKNTQQWRTLIGSSWRVVGKMLSYYADRTEILMILLNMIVIIYNAPSPLSLSSIASIFTFESKLTTKYEVELIDCTCRTTFWTRIAVFVCIVAVLGLISQLEMDDHRRKLSTGQKIIPALWHEFVPNFTMSLYSKPLMQDVSSRHVISLLLLLSGDIELNPGPENELSVISGQQQPSFPKRESQRGQPRQAKRISNVNELNSGDHILYNTKKYLMAGFRTSYYYSALVVNVDEQCSKIEIIMNETKGGVVQKAITLDELHSLYKVVYSHCQFDEEESLCRARKCMDENYHHPLCNNSHHFVSRCKTGQEYPLADILMNLEKVEEDHPCEQDKLSNIIVFKAHVKSIDDLHCGSHVMLGSDHYLVKSINKVKQVFSAYSICDKRRIKLYKKIMWAPVSTLYTLTCASHQSQIDGENALKRAKIELDETVKRKWSNSDHFVTAMLCGIEHSIEKPHLLNSDVAPTGCTLVTPTMRVQKGDHLMIKDFSNNFVSVIVQKYHSDTRVIVQPSLHEGAVIDLTTYVEVYRIDYDECLPAEEALKRASSTIGKIVLQNDHNCYVTWAKTGRKITTPISDFLKHMAATEKRNVNYVKVVSFDEFNPGDHILEYIHDKKRRRHFMITERESRQSCKIICCRHTLVQEESKTFIEGQEFYKIIYADEFASTSKHLYIDRARSYLSKQLHNPWAPMLLITWAKTGERQNFDLNPPLYPSSKNEIKSFKQLVPGDYLVKMSQSWWRETYFHYLIVSINSPMQCTAVECSQRGRVSKVELALSEQDKCQYFRINYEPGACLPNEDSVMNALSYACHKTQLDRINYQNFVHYIKTEQNLTETIDVSQISSNSSPSKYLGMPSFIREANDQLIAGDHILYRINKPPFSPIYRSAIVVQVLSSQQVEIATLTENGIVKQTHSLDMLPSLHQVVYHFCRYSGDQVVSRIQKLMDNQGNYYYDDNCNNSHHFVTRCKTDHEYSLIELVNELSLKEQGSNQLKPVLTKIPLKSIEDIERGAHIVINSQHYLVDFIEHDLDTCKLSAYTTTNDQTIEKVEKDNVQQLIDKDIIFRIDYDPHSALSDVSGSIERVRMEMRKKSKWQHSHQFVTMMKSGTMHSVDDRCYINHDVAMMGTSKLTCEQCTVIDEGDHLLIKDGNDSKRFYSVLVCEFINQTSVVVTPPVKSSDSFNGLEVLDLTADKEIYRVNYNESLPSVEVIKRAQSYAGKNILEKLKETSNYGPFVTWAKTGREMEVPIQELIKKEQIETAHPLEYKKVLTPNELQVGQHIFIPGTVRRQHYLISECNIDKTCPTKFKVIYHSNMVGSIKEEIMDLPFDSVGYGIYQVLYQDELPLDITLKRAKSCIGQRKLNVFQNWFVPWTKTGTENGIEVDLLRNLTKPVTKSRITCFTQLNKGDYLVMEEYRSTGYIGAYHHYLVESVESSEKCTVIESWRGWITRKKLCLNPKSKESKHPWYYRINYEEQICISAQESLNKAEDIIRKQSFPYLPNSEYGRRRFVHYLKTGELAKISIHGLLDDRTLLRREIVTSAMELKRGDHIERPLSLAPSYAQHHMMVVEPIDDKYCKVIHYKVHPTPGQLMKKGEIVEEKVNIFEQNTCVRICYSERIDPEIGMDNLNQLCGKKGKEELKKYTGNEEYSVIDSNCEHLVTIATLGFPVSIQVDKFIYQALQTGKGIVRSFRMSCLHHGVHITPDTVHGVCHMHASAIRAGVNSGAKATVKVGAKAAVNGSVLATVAGVAFAANVLIEGPLCLRSIYKLSRQNTFGKISLQEYKRKRDTHLITTANSIAGGTLGAVVGQAVIWQVPVVGAVTGGVVGSIVGQNCGQLEANLYCSIKYPQLCEITLPEIVVKNFVDHSILINVV